MSELPEPYQRFLRDFPEVGEAYNKLGTAAHEHGSLDPKTRELVKLGMAMGARLEGAVHSHVRRARAAGATADEIRHVVQLAVTTLGFPASVAVYTWVNDVLDKE